MSVGASWADEMVEDQFIERTLEHHEYNREADLNDSCTEHMPFPKESDGNFVLKVANGQHFLLGEGFNDFFVESLLEISD